MRHFPLISIALLLSLLFITSTAETQNKTSDLLYTFNEHHPHHHFTNPIISPRDKLSSEDSINEKIMPTIAIDFTIINNEPPVVLHINETTFQITNEDIEPFIFMVIVYSLSTLSACISNLIVILVYLFVQRTKTDLSIFLVNLAVADFLMSIVCMPFSFAQVLLKRWLFGEIMCPIGKNLFYI